MRWLAIFLATTGIAVVQLYVAGPLGLAWDLDRHSVAVAAFVGGMIGVIVLVIFGPALIERVESLVRRIARRPPKETGETDEEKTKGRFFRLVERFGAPFLWVLGPLTIGGWAAALLGRSMGMGRWALIAWLVVGQAFVTFSYVYTIAELTD